MDGQGIDRIRTIESDKDRIENLYIGVIPSRGRMLGKLRYIKVAFMHRIYACQD